MPKKPVIVWFRNDLRLADNPALAAALATGQPVIPLYVFDPGSAGKWAPGGASRWWLHHSLASLAADIATCGNELVLRSGDARKVVPALARDVGATEIFFSRSYEPWAVDVERAVKDAVADDPVQFRRFGGRLLHEPEKVRTQSGDHFKVYTPFWRALSQSINVGRAIPAPRTIPNASQDLSSDVLDDWELTPTRPDWSGGLREVWQPGEAGAHHRLKSFLHDALADYEDNRNRPDRAGTSRLSPHLAFGEISPAACWRAAAHAAESEPGAAKGAYTFMKELAWREFSYDLLFNVPTLPEEPFRQHFANFPWSRDGKALRAWQRGQTGYPIVDAGMRELWTTGYMHNRVRMIVASFLTKDLMIPWQEGEAWFWDTLVDADLANNAASWQWIAGSGADAAPYFRVFNPVTQGQKFDPEGDYVRRWVPELAGLPAAALHAPWQAGAETLARAGVTLGTTYPRPIVDHAAARLRALAAYDDVKAAAD